MLVSEKNGKQASLSGVWAEDHPGLKTGTGKRMDYGVWTKRFRQNTEIWYAGWKMAVSRSFGAFSFICALAFL